ncbi:MAG: hypothetical protein HY814_08225 [Candidatus Riflebacteria bacterium]|nr:hypothetical protein [Candidatus Riflebacteria bacterium]
MPIDEGDANAAGKLTSRARKRTEGHLKRLMKTAAIAAAGFGLTSAGYAADHPIASDPPPPPAQVKVGPSVPLDQLSPPGDQRPEDRAVCDPLPPPARVETNLPAKELARQCLFQRAIWLKRKGGLVVRVGFAHSNTHPGLRTFAFEEDPQVEGAPFEANRPNPNALYIFLVPRAGKPAPVVKLPIVCNGERVELRFRVTAQKPEPGATVLLDEIR